MEGRGGYLELGYADTIDREERGTKSEEARIEGRMDRLHFALRSSLFATRSSPHAIANDKPEARRYVIEEQGLAEALCRVPQRRIE